MTVIYQKWITRKDLRENRHIYYLFGDNLMRVGLGGQAREMRGEVNAIGVATKKAPGMHPSDFFTDDEYEANCERIDADLEMAFEMVHCGKTVVIPADGLGTGLSELPQRAPRTNEYLVARLEKLKNHK